MDEATDCPGCQQRDAMIARLQAELAQSQINHAALQKSFAELQATVRELQATILDLQKQLAGKDKPEPRGKADLPSPAAKPATGRKRGAQPDHPPHLKTRLPADRVEVIAFLPKRCSKCDASLPQKPGPDDPPPTWHQYAELPPIVAKITEYQGHSRTCPCCGEVTHEPVPAEIRAHSIGPNLTAVVAYMSGENGMSKRAIEELCETVFHVPIALGTIANLEREMSDALAGAHAEAQESVGRAPVKNLDETGWLCRAAKRWLWAAATTAAVVYIIHCRRDMEALTSLLGQHHIGILCSDRYVIYNRWPLEWCRQLCWAHLKRNWEALVERGGTAKRIGEKFLEIERRTFEAWHLFRGGGCTREGLFERVEPLIDEMEGLLVEGVNCRDARTRRFCARLDKEKYGLWTFLDVEGVEPTNNLAERHLRKAVLWRRRSFGSQSEAGCRFVERILTVCGTLRTQKRNIVEYLTAAIAAHREGHPTPKLLPVG